MANSKAGKNVDENFKLAADQFLNAEAFVI